MTKSEVVKEIAIAAGLEVYDDPAIGELAPGDLSGLPIRTIDMEKLNEVNNNFLAMIDTLPSLNARPMQRADALLTPEECRVYERFSVSQALAMAQGRRGDSVPQVDYQKVLDCPCDLPDGAKIIAWNGKNSL